MPSFFSALFRYKQRANRTPTEDFFTEALVAVLQRDFEFAVALIQDLTEREPIRESIRVESQAFYRLPNSLFSRRIDIKINFQDTSGTPITLFIESKIDSIEGENQLSDYAEILKFNTSSGVGFLFYITRVPEHKSYDFDHVVFKQMFWSDIYEIVHKHAEPSRTFVYELKRFMRELNMDRKVYFRELIAGSTLAGAAPRLLNLLNEAWWNFPQNKAFNVGKFQTYEYPQTVMIYPPSTSGPIAFRPWFGFRFLTTERWDDLELPILKKNEPVLAFSLWTDFPSEFRSTYSSEIGQLRAALADSELIWEELEDASRDYGSAALWYKIFSADTVEDTNITQEIDEFLSASFRALSNSSLLKN